MTSFNININTLSSLFFITNIIHLYYRRKIGYYLFAFLLLVIASLFHHQLDNEITNIFDKITVYLVILIGGFITYKSKYNFYSIIVIVTFVLTAYLYFFEIKKEGFLTIVKNDENYENDENDENDENNNSDKNNTYQYSLDAKYKHALMHCISSIGHHAIIANMSTLNF